MPAIFTDRETQLVFNDYFPGVSSPWIAVERKAEEMCRGGTSQVKDMALVEGIGWRLRSYMDDPGDKAYLSAAAPGYLSKANGAQVPEHYKEEDSFLKLPGVTYDGSVHDQGSPMLSAFVPGGLDESDGSLRLAGDQAAFPRPNPGEDPVAMNRVFAFPGVPFWADLLFEFQVPGSVLSSRGTFGTFYFDAGPGVDKAGAANASLEGTGHYVGKLRGDGRCYVSERLVDGSWKGRFSFYWNDSPQSVIDEIVGIRVCSRVWQDAQGRFHGDTISIIPYALGGNLISRVSEVATFAIRLAAGRTPVYRIPRVKDKSVAAGATQTVRVDLAQGCRAIFSVSKHVYVHTGYLLDDYLPFDQAIQGSEPLYVYLHGVVPSGTSLVVSATDQDGSALTVSGTTVVNTDTGQMAYATVAPSARMRGIRIKVVATANADNTLSPVIVSRDVNRSPVYTQSSPSTLPLVTVPSRATGEGGAPVAALPKTVVSSVSIQPQETDPGAENATFEVDDLTGELDFLGMRNLVPVRCRTKQGAMGEYADLFVGYVVKPTSREMRGEPGTGYANGFTRWSLQCSGEWVRTTRTLTPARKTWGQDPQTGTSFRVTDVIRYLGGMTYPPAMVDVPDVAVPLLTLDPQAYMTEANARTTDAMAQLATDYLGGYVLFDEAAGDRGMLRLLAQKHAPYNDLAIFEVDHPTRIAGDGVLRLPHFAGSYASVTVSGGQEVKRTFIQAGTVGRYLEPAEGNLVVCHGSAVGDDANVADASGAGMLQQFACDVGAYNFLGLAPGAAGYPDGSSPQYWPYVAMIRDVDFKLGSQRALDWKCRRIFERACFTRFFLTFQAPLVLVTDATDARQQRPRRLRFYDPVKVRRPDGTLAQFLVLSCMPSYHKDAVQMATYTLVTQANIDTIGAIGRRGSPLDTLIKAMGRAAGTNWTHSRPNHAQQRQGEGQVSSLMGLPTPTAPTIQDLDPSSFTFGAFRDPAGLSGGSMGAYDLIPHA